jgi:hypothetical protein
LHECPPPGLKARGLLSTFRAKGRSRRGWSGTSSAPSVPSLTRTSIKWVIPGSSSCTCAAWHSLCEHRLGTAEVPESAAVNIHNRNYAIAVDVDIQTPEAEGVLFSHVARFGGHSLYIKDRKLKCVYNVVGLNEQMIASTTQVPTGQVVLSAAFERAGDSTPRPARSRSTSTTTTSAKDGS